MHLFESRAEHGGEEERADERTLTATIRACAHRFKANGAAHMTQVEPIIDVERLVEELRERVAERRREGDYDTDLTNVPLPLAPAAVAVRPGVGAASSRPLVGRVKSVLLRLLWRQFDDLARQTNTALRSARAEAAEASSRLRADLAQESSRLSAELADTKGDLADRVTDVDARLARLELRLTELEADAAVGSSLPAGPMAYASFEDRYRPEAQVRERQAIYRDALTGRRRVVDLGCGRGELLGLLRELDVPAYGVEVDADFVAHARANDLEIVQQEAVTHLETLEPGAVDTIVASHVIEHLPPATFFRLIELAAEKLADNGLMILETPNPTSVLGGSVNFHRDPTHVHPIHPDTLAFLCEQAGFSEIEVRPLVPVPADQRLPEPAPGEGELAAHVDSVVGQLNEFLYGNLDYALFARK
jgi:SAM-dependent methyltransferase